MNTNSARSQIVSGGLGTFFFHIIAITTILIIANLSAYLYPTPAADDNNNNNNKAKVPYLTYLLYKTVIKSNKEEKLHSCPPKQGVRNGNPQRQPNPPSQSNEGSLNND